MNVIYSSDDNYTRHAGISIMSLYDHNKDTHVNVYLIDNGISDDNRAKLDSVAASYNRKITYIDFEKYKSRLVLNNQWELPISTYARLFVSEMLPEDVDKAIYLDCDIIINDSLLDMWNTDMHGCTVAAVEDVASCVFWEETDVKEQFRYVCAGVLLIDLKKWRRINAQQKIMDYIDMKKGVLSHHDQTVLNGVFHDDMCILHPRYDALTPTFIMSYDNLKAYFKLWDNYYTKQEMKEAFKRPAIIHFTSSNIGRPWENEAHPLTKIYRKYWMQSPWKDAPMGTFKPTYDEKQRRTYKLYQTVPVKIIRALYNIKK